MTFYEKVEGHRISGKKYQQAEEFDKTEIFVAIRLRNSEYNPSIAEIAARAAKTTNCGIQCR